MKIKNITLLIIVAVAFSACSIDETKSKLDSLFSTGPSCSEKDAKQLVKEITLAQAIDLAIVKKFASDKEIPMGAMAYMMYKNIGPVMALMGNTNKNNTKSDFETKLDKYKNEVNKEFIDYRFSLNDVITTQKNSSLNYVQCSSTVKFELTNDVYYEFDTKYKVQYTDNNEKIVVEVIEDENQFN